MFFFLGWIHSDLLMIVNILWCTLLPSLSMASWWCLDLFFDFVGSPETIRNMSGTSLQSGSIKKKRRLERRILRKRKPGAPQVDRILVLVSQLFLIKLPLLMRAVKFKNYWLFVVFYFSKRWNSIRLQSGAMSANFPSMTYSTLRT